MSKVLWKFPLKLVEVQNIEFPGQHLLLYAGFDPNDELCLWAEVTPEEFKPKVPRQILIIGTGEEVPKDVNYLSTVVQDDFVWHIYYK